MAAPHEVSWSVISDAAAYHTVVESLARTEIVAGSAGGMTRHCVDTKGRSWSETCTNWEEGVASTMTVDIATYPPAFQAIFRHLAGTWSVTPDGRHASVVSVRFSGEPSSDPSARHQWRPWEGNGC